MKHKIKNIVKKFEGKKIVVKGHVNVKYNDTHKFTINKPNIYHKGKYQGKEDHIQIKKQNYINIPVDPKHESVKVGDFVIIEATVKPYEYSDGIKNWGVVDMKIISIKSKKQNKKSGFKIVHDIKKGGKIYTWNYVKKCFEPK